jgi:hypothetical protein
MLGNKDWRFQIEIIEMRRHILKTSLDVMTMNMDKGCFLLFSARNNISQG